MTKKYKFKPLKNTLYPGRPNYTGPHSGYFAFVHHGSLFEYSNGIKKRIIYVQHNKPEHERPVRLRDMIYLGRDLGRYVAKLGEGNEKARAAVLAYVNAHNPGHGWSENRKTLVYPNEFTTMTGSWSGGSKLQPSEV